MDTPQLPRATATPDAKFKAGLRAVFGTTKAQSDAQLAAAAEERKKKRNGKPK